MVLKGVDFGNQEQVVGYFRREFVKTRIFPKVISNTIETLFQVRNESDYDDFYIISKENVTSQLTSAEFFLNEIQKYLDQECIFWNGLGVDSATTRAGVGAGLRVAAASGGVGVRFISDMGGASSPGL